MTDWWQAAAAPHRTVRRRAALVDRDGNEVADLPINAGTIDWRGDQSEVWFGTLTVIGSEWVPQSWDDPLDPRSGLMIRIYFALLIDGTWTEQTVCTLAIEDPDAPGATVSLRLRDPLADAKRGGYGGATPQVGGLTVPDALERLFDVAAPQARLRITATTTAELPTGYTLGERDPGEDWAEIAALAGWRVTTARDGWIEAGPIVTPPTPALDWAEGPHCPVIELGRKTNYSSTYNRVVVRATNSELVDPLTGIAEDTDPSSPTFIGRFVHELRIDSDAVITQDAADNMAALHLAGLRKPTETITGKVPPRPDLDYLQPVQIASRRHGAAGLAEVVGWSWDLASGDFQFTLATRTMQ